MGNFMFLHDLDFISEMDINHNSISYASHENIQI